MGVEIASDDAVGVWDEGGDLGGVAWGAATDWGDVDVEDGDVVHLDGQVLKVWVDSGICNGLEKDLFMDKES